MPLYIDQNTPQPNRHIRVSPFTPQWQRKLEAPRRVLIAACNRAPRNAGETLDYFVEDVDSDAADGRS